MKAALFFFCFLFSLIALAKQEKDSSSNISQYKHYNKRFNKRADFKNALTIQIPSLFIETIDLSYTRYFGRYVGIGVELAYKPILSGKKFYTNDNFLNINGPTKEILFMPFTESRYANLFAKIYIDNRTVLNMFVSVGAFYKNVNYHNATVNWEDAVGGLEGAVRQYYDSLNVDQNQQGLKFLFGVNPVFPLGKKLALELEGYAGFSVRNVTTSLYHFNFHYAGNEYDIPKNATTVIYINKQETDVHTALFAPQAGVKVGLRF